jgi:hypothetical protein
MKAFVMLLAACLIVSVLASTPAAGAATRRATDWDARVRFTLEGRLLTVRVLPRAPRSVGRELFGKRIRAVCGTRFPFTARGKVKRTRLWPDGRRRLRYRFRRDISRRAKWCLVEHPRGGDVAVVIFAR